MSDKKKPLCKLIEKDLIKKDLSSFKEIVSKAGYYCKKCGRVAKKDKQLCKPESL
ncbi:hypothetical protein [Heliorestis convoluta]|uniref:Uncharacterized protein n=1 Tax=Heliorestis convoluta TaxID=356322 RepID=A0A5Q2N0H9_9FIRM|nr:hypothetical protein [Heliorestis convoluta]QGG48498.1 hypothetical protein FTV88_2400 [Heliorestis convoluta]